MIQLNCTNCKSLLQIDDAFAGGVCRCRYCGTIQTVPKRLKQASGNGNAGVAEVEASANGGTSSAKTLFSKKASAVETAGSGTGLDDLASIVASSGLTSSRLQKKTPPPVPAEETPAVPWDRRTVILLTSAGGVIALLLIVILIMAIRSGGTATPGADQGNGQPPAITNGTPSTPPATPPLANTSPNFLGQPIDATTVAYVLDRGNYSGDSDRIGLLKTALINSVKSLGPTRKFQVVFWGVNKEPPVAYPSDGTRPANAENINALQTFLDQIYPLGTTDEVEALPLALKSRPQMIMLVPIRGLTNELRDIASRVQRARNGERDPRIYCITLGQPEDDPAVRNAFKQTGGDYRDVSLEDLKKLNRQ